MGWTYAREGKKALDASAKFDALGVTIGLEGASDGFFVVRNKESRVEKILGILSTVLSRGSMTESEASNLHGVLNFAQGQYMGKFLQPAMQFLQKIMAGGWKESFKNELAHMAVFLTVVLRCAPARKISAFDQTPPILLFTDGAYEDCDGNSMAAAGCVIHDPVTGISVVHEVQIPQAIHDVWKKTGKQQLIAECELFPILAAWQNYGSLFRGRRVLVFVDNSAIKTALVKGTSPKLELFSMLTLISVEQALNPALVWYSRVPSKSNCADGPSRALALETANALKAKLGEPLSLRDHAISFLTNSLSYPDLMMKMREVLNNGDVVS